MGILTQKRLCRSEELRKIFWLDLLDLNIEKMIEEAFACAQGERNGARRQPSRDEKDSSTSA
jgi:hypothetical protein